MKKILSIALVALLAASAFAGFKGSANVDFGFNLDSKEWGFKNGVNELEVSAELTSGAVDKMAEGEVYAGIKASFSAYLESDAINADGAPTDLILKGSISEAYITDGNWKLSILGAQGATNFATSAIDSYKDGSKTKYFNYAIPYVKAPGLTFEMAGYKASFGLWGKDDQDLKASVTFVTPDYELAEGFKLGAGASYAYQMAAKNTTANAVGASVKASYENDTLKVALGSDLGYDIFKEKFGADVAAKLTVTPVVVDFYYATLAKGDVEIENLLSAQVTTDLTAFDVPLQLTVAGKDLINKQNLSAKVVVPVAPVTITAEGGYGIQEEKWNAGASVKYTHDMFVAAAGVSVSGKVGDDNVVLGANASISSEALVPGATLTLAWKDGKDLLNDKYGKIAASCKIAF